MYVELFILSLIASFLLYKWLTKNYTELSERGIPHDKPIVFLGNVDWKTLVGKVSFMRSIIDRYDKFKGSKIYAVYNFQDIIIFIRDVELVKKIGIKDFDMFPNHKSPFTQAQDSIFSKSLIALEDRKWKEMRNTLTPSFTGSKMRLMFELINECCLEGVKYIEMEMKANSSGELELEMKEYFTKFTNDIIASTAFGIKVNSFKDKNNEFYTIGRSVTQFRGIVLFKAILFGIIPKIMKALRVKILDETKINYLSKLVLDAMRYRAEHNIIRPDMIHLLMEAKRSFEKNKQQNISQAEQHAQFNDEDLLAQCVLFFIAGFDTVSTCLSFTTWELVMNPEVQERLYEEILEVEQDLNGKPLNYDVLMKMKYMDMVLSESLRKWPPAIVIDRVCAANYKLHDEDGNFVAEIKEGEQIFMPAVAYHYDPEYFPDPKKFDPDRFSEKNKDTINQLAYLPFGVGPRNCIGNRFALMETKAIIYHILLKFKMTASERTCKNMYDSIQGFQMIPKELFWIKFSPRAT